eukprot:COSAG05_NODE_6374_length_971_cov_1.111239_1_plen_178_part_10
MASMLQSAFRSKRVRHAMSIATDFLVRTKMEIRHNPHVISILESMPAERSDEDLAEILDVFGALDFVTNLGSRLLQTQFCRYLRVSQLGLGEVLFTEGDVGDKFFIVVEGKVEYTVKNGAVKLQSGNGDCFGEQALRGENHGRRDATVIAQEHCTLAVLERADYMRTTGALEGAVLEV